MIKIHNSLSGKKEEFVPVKPGDVGMYVCGPTVYGLTHVGNARPVVFFDFVRRFLEFSGYHVTYVSNFTDVDDKILQKALIEKITPKEVAEKYANAFIEDMQNLGVRPPDVTPKVTEMIPQIIEFISTLVKNNSAYVTSKGEVLFSVRGFSGYGKLSKKNVDDLLAGARVDPGEDKRDPLDFSLWKPQKPGEALAWESPWGKGRPGWHIECSVMATQILGPSIDIHGGGVDLVHPHHENEIAQSEAATSKPYVKYWMHSGMLTLDKEKMSKSVGNLFLTRDFITSHHPEVLRFLLLSVHYRSSIDFSPRNIQVVEKSLHRFYSTVARVEQLLSEKITPMGSPSAEELALEKYSKEFPKEWKEALEDDFNTAKVIGFVFEYIRVVNSTIEKKGFKCSAGTGALLQDFVNQTKVLSEILNIFGENASEYLSKFREKYLLDKGLMVSDIEKKIDDRAQARIKKEFQKADDIRKELLEQGIELRDGKGQTTWEIFFAPED